MIDPTTGKLAGETCIHIKQEIFIAGTEPVDTCNDYYHSLTPEYFTSQHAGLTDLAPGSTPVWSIIAEAASTETNSEVKRFENQAAYLALIPKSIRFVFTNKNLSEAETGEQAKHD